MNRLKQIVRDFGVGLAVLAIAVTSIFFSADKLAGNSPSEPITYEILEDGGLRAYWIHEGADYIYEHKTDGTEELSVPVGDITTGDIRPNVIYVLRKNGSMLKNGEPFSDKNLQTQDARSKFFYVMGRAKMVYPESFKRD